MEERKLRAEEEQRRAVREQETREAVCLQRGEEKQRQAEREHQARDGWKVQFKMVARLALDGWNREGEQIGCILKEAEAKVAKHTEKDDIEVYLATFERIMTAYEVNRQQCVYKLAAQLSEKAQQAYTAMSSEEAVDYERVKAAILKRYDINEETYRLWFRSVVKSIDESHREVAVRVKDLVKKWLKQQPQQKWSWRWLLRNNYSTRCPLMFMYGCVRGSRLHVWRRVSLNTTTPRREDRLDWRANGRT